MINEGHEREVKNDEVQPSRPELWFNTITFSDENTLILEKDSIVVFVGPNNAGKSAALRELETWVARSTPGVVIKNANLHKEGTAADLRTYLDINAQKNGTLPNLHYGGIGFNIHDSNLKFFDRPDDRHPVAAFFANRLSTENRITASNAAPSIALHQDIPNHPIHLLLMDEELAQHISDKFKYAFGEDLIPFRAGGNQFPLYVGQKPMCEKDELSKEFVVALKESSVPLANQGDGMRSFASVILHVLAAPSHSIQFLDEPEAFLHPPQARLLARDLAESKVGNVQLFIATHSTDVLEGLIEGGSDRVRIVRLRREGDVNHIRELDKERTRAVVDDTLARFSRVFEGIFFEHVFICEADADCMFYHSILNLRSISGDRRPDVLFVHASGKHRMARLAEMLRSLDVPVSVIADIDILNEKETFSNLFETLGGDWDEVKNNWKAVCDAVDGKHPPHNAEQVKTFILKELDEISGTELFPKEKERAIRKVFKITSSWGIMKSSGRTALPSGQPTQQFDWLLEKCQNCGLWIVPVGELEGFCRSSGSHGPAFVEKTLEAYNIETAPELKDARDFVKKIWEKARSPSTILRHGNQKDRVGG